MIVLLPIGAVEAHGPHLPLDTDTRIAVELARRCAAALGSRARVVEPFTTTAAAYAASFPGTVSVPPAEETRLLAARIGALLSATTQKIVLVNLHFDPAHMGAVKAALAEVGDARVVWPNFTRRAHAEAIGGEFLTGACHGGEFETSLMLVAAPDAVKPMHRSLPEVHVDLPRAIRDGKKDFRDIGMDRAYCGHPATASTDEGERVYSVLVEIVLREIGL